MSMLKRHACPGFTLIETMVTVVILSLVATTAMTIFTNMRQTLRLKNLSQVVMIDLRLAQNESIKRKITITFNISNQDGIWCYGLNEHTGCDCQTPNACRLDSQEKVVSSTEHSGLTILSGVTNNRFNFRPQRQTVTAGHVKVQGMGKEVRVVVSGYGRIRECSPAGSSNLSPLPTCT